MDVHKNARTTPHSRALIVARVQEGQSVSAVAEAFGICERTVRKWVPRGTEGAGGLEDRSCRPHRSPGAIAAGEMVAIAQRRQLGWTVSTAAQAEPPRVTH